MFGNRQEKNYVTVWRWFNFTIWNHGANGLLMRCKNVSAVNANPGNR